MLFCTAALLLHLRLLQRCKLQAWLRQELHWQHWLYKLELWRRVLLLLKHMCACPLLLQRWAPAECCCPCRALPRI